eukprot:COSAG05_NODE_1717_length_4225_cov_67.463160_3_plen_387_part_00
MPGRGPRVAPEVLVWSKLADLLVDHPELKEKFDRYFPRGHAGKWIQGKVTGSVARQVNQQPVWDVHYVGTPSAIAMNRRRFDTAFPAVHKAAVIDDAQIGLAESQIGSADALAATTTTTADAATDAANADDVVQAGDVSWTFSPVGATRDCRPEIKDPNDRREEFLGAERVKWSAPLKALTDELKNGHPKSSQKWRELFTMFWPGDIEALLKNCLLAADKYGQSSLLAHRPLTRSEYINVMLLLVDGAAQGKRSMQARFSDDHEGRVRYPDMTDVMPLARFREALKIVPFAFADEACMRHAQQSVDAKYGWGMFRNMLSHHAMTRAQLIATWIFCMDEDMIPYCPKNSATGDLDNITHEDRKPVKTGVCARSTCCAITRVLGTACS